MTTATKPAKREYPKCRHCGHLLMGHTLKLQGGYGICWASGCHCPGGEPEPKATPDQEPGARA